MRFVKKNPDKKTYASKKACLLKRRFCAILVLMKYSQLRNRYRLKCELL